ncbi:hypothetical protein EG329_002809 [Mollisiaceae sp. DMI_Dod_QoI]|nr:hypothetical protein EG329_002809 [Helotiales sp. DMI_Dod_QoI]
MTNLKFICPAKVLGQFGHVSLPAIKGGRGSTIWMPASALRGDGVNDEGRLDVRSFIDSKIVDPCGEGEMKVWFPLSSSNEGFESVEAKEESEEDRFRTAQPPAMYWLVSETKSVRSR